MNSRQISAKVIVNVLSGQSLTAALEEAWELIEAPQDKAFIQAICYGTIRYYYRLDFILNKLVHKPIKDSQVKALALIGLYQLQFMRVKAHAAVSETVAVMKKKQWAKSLLNAVLRRYLREQAELEALADKHVAYNHPDWMIKAIKADWPEQAAAIFAENNQSPPMILRVNQHFCSREAYLALLAAENIEATALTTSKDAILLTAPVLVNKLPKFSEGWASVQDGAAQLAASLLDIQTGQRVLDICAAPGGKTAHILEQHENIKVAAVDIDGKRLERVKENLQRLHLQAELLIADASEPEKWWDGKPFERILLDAPCSALGVIRRHPDIKLLRRADDIDELQLLQAKILAAAWRMLAVDGILVYATCSILKQENEQQIKAFLQTHEDAEELVIEADWGISRPFGRQIVTGQQSMDGFYYARLRKK